MAPFFQSRLDSGRVGPVSMPRTYWSSCRLQKTRLESYSLIPLLKTSTMVAVKCVLGGRPLATVLFYVVTRTNHHHRCLLSRLHVFIRKADQPQADQPPLLRRGRSRRLDQRRGSSQIRIGKQRRCCARPGRLTGRRCGAPGSAAGNASSERAPVSSTGPAAGTADAGATAFSPELGPTASSAEKRACSIPLSTFARCCEPGGISRATRHGCRMRRGRARTKLPQALRRSF